MNYRVVLFPLWVEANLEWCLLVSSETLDWYFFWYVAYNAFIFFRFFFFLGRTLNFNWVIYTVDHRKELLHAFHYVMIDLSMHGTLFKQQSTSKELQKETMFLGVSLMDRFLSKGFFKNKRNLQIVGIACLALATRIEENQPFNR